MALFDICINLIQSATIVFFIDKSSTHKNNYKSYYKVVFTVFYTMLITLFNHYLTHEGLLGIMLVGLFYIYTSVISSDTLIKKIIISSVPYILMGIIITSVLSSLSYLMYSEINFISTLNNHYVLCNLLVSVLLFVLCFLLINPIKSLMFIIKKSDMIYFMILSLSINAVNLFFESIFFLKKINELSLILAYSCQILSLGLIFVIIHKMNYNYKILSEKELELTILSNDLKHNEHIFGLENEIYKMKHDIKHLLAFKEDKDEAIFSNLIDKYNDDINDMPLSFNTKNKVLNHVLRSKKDAAVKNGINISITTNIIRELNIDDVDFYLLLINMFDNAIENCSSNNYIKFNIYNENDFTIIKEINSTIFNIPSLKQTIPSSKQSAGHGHGLEKMKAIVEKYNGSMIIAQKKDEFVIDIEMKV